MTSKPKTLIDRTEKLLNRLHNQARRRVPLDAAVPEGPKTSPLSIKEQLALLEASTRYLAARAKLVPDDGPGSMLSSLRDELNDAKPGLNGAARDEGTQYE